MQGPAISRRVDGDCGDLQGAAGPDDADRNLAAVGNQDFLKHDGLVSVDLAGLANLVGSG